jgi:lipid-binding SYLF domain-containing protein
VSVVILRDINRRDIQEVFVKNCVRAISMFVVLAVPVFAQSKFDDRLSESAEVLRQMSKPSAIPPAVLDRAACVLVFPMVKKVGIGLGVTYGRGVLVCRKGADMDGRWSAPAMYSLNVGSLGVQLGSSATDYVLVVDTQRGALKILSGKLKLGADASAVAGPTGAKAVGANDPNVDILTYSRAKGGLFAGASLGSASMQSDDDANKAIYGKDIDATQIIRSESVPASGASIVEVLTRLSPKRIQ